MWRSCRPQSALTSPTLGGSFDRAQGREAIGETVFKTSIRSILLASAAAAGSLTLALSAGVTPTNPPAAPAPSQSFVNFESPHVSPLDITPDGTRLLAVNTGDNRLEVFDLTQSVPERVGAVQVGLEPVSVRARTNSEAWVVNHISDTVSIVDLDTMHVIATIFPGDEPCDVVFAGQTELAFVSVSQENRVLVFDPNDLDATPIPIEIAGEDPRALATDGTSVYAAIFESGNLTTVIDDTSVSFPGFNPYPGSPNPPPNDGLLFDPPLNDDLPRAPRTALVLKQDASGAWLDDNTGDWSDAVTWGLHDHDIAVIDADSFGVHYAAGTMNLNMAISPNPAGGVTVVGTDATNEVRFEPNLNGTFVRVMGAGVGAAGNVHLLTDLNPHLDYASPRVDQATRDLSIGDPRGVAWTGTGDRAFITGMGSNNVLVTDANLAPVARVEVGEGPTGIRIDASDERLYVLNKFDGTVSVIDAATLLVVATVEFYDPTPTAITAGRPFLYDTHRTSGLGQASCASCHIDGRMDQLAWDLGDPSGEEKPFNQLCRDDFNTNCEDWHPMKGPMTTQTLVGILGGTEPLHWRGDREDLDAFNPAFVGLLGDDVELADEEMLAFTEMIRSLTPVPNPNRNFDSSLPTTSPNGGNPSRGRQIYQTANLDGPFNCVDCHSLENGTDQFVTSAILDQTTQSINSPHLLNTYDKASYDRDSMDNNSGFGFIHDGTFESLLSFFNIPAFTFRNDQQRFDIIAFMLAFSDITHAGVGTQLTLPEASGGARASLAEMVDVAATGAVGLVAKGILDGEHRGYYMLDPETFQSDRAAEQATLVELFAAAGPGQEFTWTVVPLGSEVRIGADRDEDGYFDRDEIDAGFDPADPRDCPSCCPADFNGDGVVDTRDFIAYLGAWSAQRNEDCSLGDCTADTNGDGVVDTRDFVVFLNTWTTGC